MTDSTELRPRLQAVWEHATPEGCDHMQHAFRYIPRCVDRDDGEWNVWDRKAQRFLRPYEIVAIPLEILHSEKHYDA